MFSDSLGCMCSGTFNFLIPKDRTMASCLPTLFSRGHCSLRTLAFYLVLMAAFAFFGCTSRHAIPRDEQPPLPEKTLLKHWQHVSEKSHSSPSPHQGPLTVDQVISEALRASPELEQIRQRIEAASEQILQADASFYPRLVVSERYNTTNNPVYALMNIINQRRLQSDVNFNNPGTQQDFATRIRADLSLFEGGSRYYQQQAAVHYKDSVQAELMAARNQMVAQVVEIYYHWVQALGFIGVAQKGLESADKDVDLAEARYKAEMALPSEIMRLKAHRRRCMEILLRPGQGRVGCRQAWRGFWSDRSAMKKFPNLPCLSHLPYHKASPKNRTFLWSRPSIVALNWPVSEPWFRPPGNGYRLNGEGFFPGSEWARNINGTRRPSTTWKEAGL